MYNKFVDPLKVIVVKEPKKDKKNEEMIEKLLQHLRQKGRKK